MAGAGLMVESGPPGAASLAGEAIEHSSNGTATAGVRINSDGTMSKREGSSYSQIDSGTDWVIPNGASSDPDWEVMCEQNSGDTLGGGSAALDTWITLATMQWYVQESSDKSSKSANLTLSLRWNGGDVLATGVYTLFAENT